ncbi:MAG TPA: hypothetical protein VGH98_08685 [Gemmatimonadaceae bacterium]
MAPDLQTKRGFASAVARLLRAKQFFGVGEEFLTIQQLRLHRREQHSQTSPAAPQIQSQNDENGEVF